MSQRRLNKYTRHWCAGIAIAMMAAGCTSDGDEKPPTVETAQPEWTAESGSLPSSKPSDTAPQRQSKTRDPAAPYLISTPEKAAADADAHLATLLSSDAAVLHPNEVGYYIDTQEARLIQLLKNTDVAARRDGDVMFFSIGGGDTFASNGSRLSDSARERLAPVARVLEEYDRTRISIFGFTDDVGEAAYNQQLSVRRARAIARLLVDSGVAPERLFIVGYGELDPVADNSTEAGRARNRRIELKVEPLTRPTPPEDA